MWLVPRNVWTQEMGQEGKTTRLARTRTSALMSARRLGYATKSAAPNVGFAASANPAHGKNAAAVRSGDHCAKCAAAK